MLRKRHKNKGEILLTSKFYILKEVKINPHGFKRHMCMIYETALNTFNEIIQTANIMSTVLCTYIVHKNYRVSALRRI